MKNIFFRLTLAVTAVLSVFLYSCQRVEEGDNSYGQLAVRSFVPEMVEAGQTLSIIGNRMGDVTSVEFAGGAKVTAVQKVGHDQIDVIVPSGTESGIFRVITKDGAAESTRPLNIADAEVQEAFPAELQTMDVLTINGKDLNSVKEIVFPDDVVVPAMNFERKCNEQITVKVPFGTIDGNGMIRMNTYGGKTIDVINASITVVEIVDPSIVEEVLWEGNEEVDWSDTRIAFPNTVFSSVPAGAVVHIYFEPVPTNWAVLKIKKSVSQNKTFDKAANPDGNWGYAVDENSTECSFEVTENDLALIASDPGGTMCVQGQGYVRVTKVTVVYEKAPDITLWEGLAEVDWSDTNIAISNEPFAKAAPGSRLNIFFEPVPTNWAVLKIKCSVSQNVTFENAANPVGNWGYAVDENSTECSFEITAYDLERIAADAGGSICVQGQGYVKVTKVTLSL